MSRPARDLQLNLSHLGVAQWCSLLAHQCDGVAGACTCTCHESRGAHDTAAPALASSAS